MLAWLAPLAPTHPLITPSKKTLVQVFSVRSAPKSNNVIHRQHPRTVVHAGFPEPEQASSTKTRIGGHYTSVLMEPINNVLTCVPE